MNITAMTAMMLTAAAAASARSAVPPSDRTVTVCTEGNGVGHQAQRIASEIFARIDVIIRWRQGLRGCPPRRIIVTLSQTTPSTLKPGALASALPYEGTRIIVFYDRISETCTPSLLPRLLAYVLVHEITHILQGIVRHSDHGIMRARWNADDFKNIGRERLGFQPDDIGLIYAGLATRAARATVGRNAEPAAFSTR